MKRQIWLFHLVGSLLVFLSLPSYADDCPSPDLVQKINRLLNQRRYTTHSWGIQVVDLDTAQVVYTKNADKIFVPASNTKLFTTGTALARLRPDFRLKTRVYSNGGEISNDGTLTGNLILEGRGDPALSTRPEDSPLDSFSALARQIADRGITRIEGDIIGDDSYFIHSTVKIKNHSEDYERDIAVALSALSVNGGFVRVYAAPAEAPGKKVAVHMEPETNFYKIINKGVTSARRTRRTLKFTKKGNNQILVTGRLPLNSWGASRAFSVVDPPYFAATLFKEALERAGVKVSGKVKSNHRDDNFNPNEIWVQIAEYQSEPLIKLIDVINKESKNVYAEMLLRILGAELKDEGSSEAGLQVEREFFNEIGISAEDISLADGSGLSRRNLVTPRAITRLLEYVHRTDFFEPFFNSLAVSGVDGTLKRRFDKLPATKERIHAKTGTLSNACCLSGYLSTNCGKKVVFSIIANRFRVRQLKIRNVIDEICNLIVNYY